LLDKKAVIEKFEGRYRMEITKDTKIADIFDKYGDISEIMIAFGMEGVSHNKLRNFLEKRITVKWAAKIHKTPLDEFLVLLNKAVAKKENQPLHE